MMINDLVSVIVTCYNQEKYIAQTLKSVLDQSYSNWECIIVDDGSTDLSPKITSNFIKDDDRFVLLKQTNTGVTKARNAGFKLAKGDFIQFLDGDDTLLPHKLKTQLTALAKHPNTAICICDHQFYLEDSQRYTYFKFERLDKKPLKQLLYGWHAGVAFPPHAPLYKKSLWLDGELPFPEDYKYRCEDWVFNVLVALKDQNYIILEDVLCTYHMSSNNYTSNTKNLAAAAIKAAIYLNPKIPKQYQTNFIDRTVSNSLDLYLDSEKNEVLNASGNWRLGNFVTKPFFDLKKGFKKMF